MTRGVDQFPALLQLGKGPSVSPEDIKSLELWSGGKLPHDYGDLLRSYGAIEGYPNGEDFVSLWRPTEVQRMNAAYRVKEYATGLVIVGSNGCGEAIAYDVLGTNARVVHVPFVGLGRDRISYQSENLAGYLEKLYGPNPQKSRRGHEIELVEIKPILFGGDPIEPKNKVFLNREKHIEFVNFWNAKLRDLTGSM